MSDNDVRIKLSLDGADQVKSGLAGVGDGASSADSKIGGLVKGGLKGAGVALVGFATAAAAAGGALAKSVIDNYAQYEQNVGGIETMFGAAGMSVEEYAKSVGKSVKDASKEYGTLMTAQQTMLDNADKAYQTAGLSANDYMANVTGFSAALIQGLNGDTVKAAAVADMAMVDMSDNANKFGSNIGDIQNAYQGFAKQNYTMLDNLKLGYGGTATEMARLINDSGVMGDTFVATAKNINEVPFDKILEGIHTVQDEMGIAGTTTKEATETISGSIGMLQGAWANLLTGLGSADADISTLASNVIDSFSTVVDNITPVIENIGTNIGTLGPKIGSMMTGLVGAISSAIPAVLEAGTAIIGGLIQGIASAAPGLITAIVPALVGLVQMIATQLPLLVDSGMKTVIALAQGLVTAIPSLIPAVVAMVMGVVQAIVDNLPMLLDVALQLVLALADGLLASIPVLLEMLPALIESLVTYLVGASPQIIQAGIQLLMALIDALPTVIAALVEALPQIITAVVMALIGAIPQIIQAGIQLFIALVSAMPTIVGKIVTAVPQIVNGLVSALSSSAGRLTTAGFQLITSMVKDVGSMVSKVRSAIPPIISGLVSAITSGVGQMASAGRSLVTGIWNGISGAAGWLAGQVRSFASGILSSMKNALGIHSPSKKMAEIGKYAVQGFAKGIKGTESQAKSAIESMTEKIQEAMNKGLVRRSTGNSIIKYIKEENKEIQKALKDRVKILDKLKDAKKDLADIKGNRKAEIASIQGSVVNSVDVTDYKTLDEAKAALKARIDEVTKFKKKLDSLQKMGLDDTSRDALLDDFLKGKDSTIADQLLAGGKKAVGEFADLQKQLASAGKGLGTVVADDMYNAGIAAAQGLVNGLQSQEKALEKVAKSLATGLVKSIKKELKIKSPSQRFRDEVGAMLPMGIGEGVVENLDKALKPVRSMSNALIEEVKGLSIPELRTSVAATSALGTSLPTQVLNYVTTPQARSMAPSGPSTLRLDLGTARIEGRLEVGGDGIGQLVDARLSVASSSIDVLREVV